MRFVYGHRNRPNPDINLEPMDDWELNRILNRETNNKRKSVLCFAREELIWGPQVEVGVVETLAIQGKDFLMSEALCQVTTPKLNREEINFIRNLSEGRKMESWSNIRQNMIKELCKYTTTVKLWDAQYQGGPLYQEYPKFLSAADFYSPNKRVQMDIPDNEKQINKDIRNLLYKCNKLTDKAFVKSFAPLDDSSFFKLEKTMNRILTMCKNAVPYRAFNDKNINKHIR